MKTTSFSHEFTMKGFTFLEKREIGRTEVDSQIFNKLLINFTNAEILLIVRHPLFYASFRKKKTLSGQL